MACELMHTRHTTKHVGADTVEAILQGYLPAQLYNLDSCYGTKEQLQSLTWALNYAGIKPVADIVINHRCADVQNADGIWNSYRYLNFTGSVTPQSKVINPFCNPPAKCLSWTGQRIS